MYACVCVCKRAYACVCVGVYVCERVRMRFYMIQVVCTGQATLLGKEQAGA